MKRVKKTYGHELGLSAVFRQWRAKSHCRFFHGYALAFAFTFECADDEVDENGWVINFGGLKPLKEWLQNTFDHKMLIAEDDPYLDHILDAIRFAGKDVLAQPVIVPAVGCEAFAVLAWEAAQRLCDTDVQLLTKARCIEVECREHGANAASYIANGSHPFSNHVIIGGVPAAEAIRRAVEAQVTLTLDDRRRRNVR